MSKVDERRLALVARLSRLSPKTTYQTVLLDVFLLGMSFPSAWLSASELRMGGELSPDAQRELDAVRNALSGLGWEDLLDA